MKASNPPLPSEELTLSSLDPLTQSFIYGQTHEYQEQFNTGGYHIQTKIKLRPVPDNLVPITLESLKSRLSMRLQEMKVGVK